LTEAGVTIYVNIGKGADMPFLEFIWDLEDIGVVYEQVDENTVYPITAFELEED